MNFESKVQENAYYQEWAYVQGRKFLLTLLALGSLLITFRIGDYIGGLLFPYHETGRFTVTIVFVFLGYMGIDWVLANALASASNVDEKSEKKSKRSAWIFAGTALLTTIGLSVASNFFISSEMAGQSHLEGYNQQVKGAMVNDSLMKMKAFSLLETLGDRETKLVKVAETEKKRIVNKAILTGSTTWKNDYYDAKENPKAWFWTCNSCPSEFKRYRRRILNAMQKGDEVIAEARKNAQNVQNSLSSTISHQVSNDSALAIVRKNTLSLEKEREEREGQLNLVLMILTIGTGILAFILTLVLRDHRLTYGQQVSENHVRLLMVLLDMVGRLFSTISDLIYTLLAQPFSYLKQKGWIKTYRLTDSNESLETVHASEERVCLCCKNDINHRRSDAKYCSDTCRMEYHNYKPRRKINGSTIARNG